MIRALDLVAKASFVLYIAFFLYGACRYPDAPIRECRTGDGYCNKQGQPRTIEDYNGFQQWRSALPWVVGLCLLSGVFLNRESIGRAITRK